MPSPEKPEAKPTEPMEVEEVEERHEYDYEEEDDSNIKEEVNLPPIPTVTVIREESIEEEPVKIEVMLPELPSKGAEDKEAGRLLSAERSPSSKSSGTSKSSSQKSRGARDTSVSPNRKTIPCCTVTKSPDSEDNSSSGTPPRSRKKSRTPEKKLSPKLFSFSRKSSPGTPEKNKLESKSETGQSLSPKSPSPRSKSPRSPIKNLVEGIGLVGRMMREHSPRNLRKIFKKKDDHGSEDEDSPLIGSGSQTPTEKSKSAKSKKTAKSKNKSPRVDDPTNEADDYIKSETPLLESDDDSGHTLSTELASTASELKDEKDLANAPKVGIEESTEMDTDDEQKSLSENEPESPPETTPPLADTAKVSGETSAHQPQVEAVGMNSGEKSKPERSSLKDLKIDDPKDEVQCYPLKRSKTE